MWIRSQDRKLLTKVDDILIANGSRVFIDCHILGTYSTQEKALKVLDRIGELIENQCGLTFYMPADDEVKV